MDTAPETANDWRNTKKAAKALSPEKRKEILADIWAHKKLGDIARAHGLPLSTVCGVVNLNINKNEFLTLNEESI